MPAKKKGRVTPKGTQPKQTGRGSGRSNVPPAGKDNQATPGAGGAAARARVTPNKSATFRHRSR
jgi:hypothetical protein